MPRFNILLPLSLLALSSCPVMAMSTPSNGDYQPSNNLQSTDLLAANTATKENAVPDVQALNERVAIYKHYVVNELAQLVNQTQTLVEAIKRGDLEQAKKLYAPTRVHYERIQAVVELFPELNRRIDAREDDFEKKAQDPNFSGFHRLEKTLFEHDSTQGLATYAEQLLTDSKELQAQLNNLTLPPSKVVGGAAALIEAASATKIGGEEEHYSHADLWDLQANVDGAQKIVDILRPLLEKQQPQLLSKIDINFAKVDQYLSKYRTPEGFETYDHLSFVDRIAVKALLTILAEQLSQLRGVLGLE
jgi:iron uptake system component EfeO